MSFNFSIHYKKGRDNVVADALSCCHGDEKRQSQFCSGSKAQLLPLSVVTPEWLDTIGDEVQNHPDFQEKLQLLRKGELSVKWKLVDGILYFKDRIHLASNSFLLVTILREMHTTTHENFLKTMQMVKQVFHWEGLDHSVKDFIKQCEVCKATKLPK